MENSSPTASSLCVCVIHIQKSGMDFLELLLMPDTLVLKEGFSGNSALQNSCMLFCPPDFSSQESFSWLSAALVFWFEKTGAC